MRRSILLTALSVSCAGFLLSAGVVAADDPSDGQVLAVGSDNCNRGIAQVGHGSTPENRYAYSETDVYHANGGTCDFGSPNYKDAGKIRARAVLQKRFNGDWGTCIDGPIRTSSYNTFVWNATVAYTENWMPPPCGDGLYRARSYNHVYWDGSWHGGTLTSPSHNW